MRAGVDIGGTKTEAVALADDGTIAHRVRIPTGHGVEAVVDAATSVLDALRDAVGPLASIGVGIPGAVDSRAGVVTHALNLGVKRLELAVALRERTGLAVRVENDVNAAAMGAFHLLALPPHSSMAYLNLGTGLASGIVLDGRLWRGSRGAAGEIGHIVVDPSGPTDLAGVPGGLEVVASGSGVARQWGGAVPSGGEVLDVLAAADAGDALALAIRERLHEGVATAVRILVLTLDVETVVIGGGLSRLGSRLLDGVDAAFGRWAASSDFIGSLELASRVRLLEGDEPVAALGAAHLGGLVGELV
jgi:predicted NBD/HSP70 family sugar kinase